jgi:hypothetical protein
MEDGKCDNVNTDPYEESTPEKVLEYVRATATSTVIA